MKPIYGRTLRHSTSAASRRMGQMRTTIGPLLDLRSIIFKKGPERIANCHWTWTWDRCTCNKAHMGNISASSDLASFHYVLVPRLDILPHPLFLVIGVKKRLLVIQLFPSQISFLTRHVLENLLNLHNGKPSATWYGSQHHTHRPTSTGRDVEFRGRSLAGRWGNSYFLRRCCAQGVLHDGPHL